MDAYTPRLLAAGLRAMIGKGSRTDKVKEAIKEYESAYLAAVGGAAALIAKAIVKSEIVAYEELGPSGDEMAQGHFMSDRFLHHCLRHGPFKNRVEYTRTFKKLADW